MAESESDGKARARKSTRPKSNGYDSAALINPTEVCSPADHLKTGFSTASAKPQKSGCRRMLYWGTILAQYIITTVSLTFLYYNSYFWPLVKGRRAVFDVRAALHLLFFVGCSVLTQYNFLMSIFVGPGHVPEKWAPSSKQEMDKLQYCSVCEGYKAPRSHHCRSCGKCVLKMEHHCPWINNCVGHRNHAYFMKFLFFAIIGCAHATVVFVLMLCRFVYVIANTLGTSSTKNIYFSESLTKSWTRLMKSFDVPEVIYSLSGMLWLIMTTGFAIGVVIAVGLLFILQLRIVWRNETSIERWIISKANYYLMEEAQENSPDGKPEKSFKNPYNKGWRENLQQLIFNRSGHPMGDGIQWPVVEGADQFTLTSEQIRQKQFKRESSVTFLVQKPYDGDLFPLRSQGVRVCCACPWTLDEPRLILKPGDYVKVTRFQKRWLYGSKIPVSTSAGNEGDVRVVEEKGWFPRQVAEKVRG